MEIKGKDLKLDPAEIEENKKKAEERFSLFKSYGYDRHKSQAFLIKKVGPIKGPVLEIGTGKGYMAAQLAKKAPSLLTVDISKEEQRLAVLNIAAESGLEQVGFLVCDAAKLPYPDNSFELVISVNAFHHFEAPFAVVAEMMRICKKKLVIADFNRQGFEIVRKIHQAEGHQHEEHQGDFGIVGVYLKEQGFSVKKFDDYCQLVYVAEKIKTKGGE